MLMSQFTLKNIVQINSKPYRTFYLHWHLQFYFERFWKVITVSSDTVLKWQFETDDFWILFGLTYKINLAYPSLA
jgi:hypothetical protein